MNIKDITAKASSLLQPSPLCTPVLHGAGAAVSVLLLLCLIFSLNAEKYLQKRSSSLFNEVIEISVQEKHAAKKTQEPIQTAPLTQNDISTQLPPAPVKSISEPYKGGILPIISLDGITPFDVYRKPVAIPPASQAVIGIALNGYGLSDRMVKKHLIPFLIW